MESFIARFSELAIGQNYSSEGRTITETDLALSCMLSTDWHPIHADQDYAARTPAGKRVLHGSFGILIALGMATRLPIFAEPVIGATGLADWRFRKPLTPGDTVRVESVIEGKRVTSDGRRAIVERRLILRNQHYEVTQEGLLGTMIQLEETP